MKFFVACENDIKNGMTSDIYFHRTKQILELENVKSNVVAEITVQGAHYPWLVFAGLEEVAYLLEGKHVDLYALPEGTIFREKDADGIPVPVMVLKGDYKQFAVFETALLGLICQASGIATKTARFKKKIGKNHLLISFGVRRMHPALAPMIDHYAYISGCDGVSSIIGAERLGVTPTGTMPHSLILTLGQENAWRKFDTLVDKTVSRIALIDTFGDEKWEAIKACETITNLKAVRLDTPRSRRGNFAKIVKEVRWELNIRGYKNVEIFVSGGIKEDDINPLLEAGATGFGIGTAISSAQVVDFAMDIVAIDHRPVAKKGKFGGEKDVYVCEKCGTYQVVKAGEKPKYCKCGGKHRSALIHVIKDGKIIYKFKPPEVIRDYVLQQLEQLEL